MFDLPSDIPPQTSTIIVAQASNTQKSDLRIDYSIGACQLIQNPPNQPTATNTMSPVLLVYGHLKNSEKLSPDKLTAEIYNAASFKMVKNPKYGKLVLEKNIDAAEYLPNDPNYIGNDRSSIIVNFGNLNIKVTYFFKLMRTVPGGTEGFDPYEDKENCPNGIVWKINEI